MRYWLLCGKLKVIENRAYGYHIGGETMGIKTSRFEKIMGDAVQAISDLSNRLEKAEKERDDALELLHSYRHIFGETPPERLSELVQADHEGRYIIMRDAERNGVARLKELSEADREGRCAILSEPMKPLVYKPNDTDVYCPNCGETLSGGWPLSDADDCRKLYQCFYCGQSIDTEKCEPYESSLKERW